MEEKEMPKEGQEGSKKLVLCFVCKKNVEVERTRAMEHPVEKSVRVCQEHIKI